MKETRQEVNQVTNDEPHRSTDNNEDELIYMGHGEWTPRDPKYIKGAGRQLQYMTKMERMESQIENEDLMLAELVRKGGYPNRFGAKIPIKTKWNIELLADLLKDYEDKDIVEWMKYGWPTGRLPTLRDPIKTYKNHKGAIEHPRALEKYIQKENRNGAIIGPFEKIPFTAKVGISPISTRPKKNTTERRVIIDLSFPEGQAVNSGMIKDNYMGMEVKLSFPGTDQLALRIYRLGPKAHMYKIDLSRYFRQLDLDPGDYSLIGYMVEGKLYFDKVIPMGMRTAPYIAQRVTNALRHIHNIAGYFLLNYVDDFLGAELKHKAQEAFKALTQMLDRLRVDTAPDKIVPPTTRIEFLGNTFDSEKMTIEVPPDKLTEIRRETSTWLLTTVVYRRELESLIGKLQFVAKCVKAGRVFIGRLLEWLRSMNRTDRYRIPLEARKDIAWWAKFIHIYNGISIIWLHQEPEADQVMATDASMKGFGGTYRQQYFKGNFPQYIQKNNIAHLEIRAGIAGSQSMGPTA